MKVYLAGVPGGVQVEREKQMAEWNVRRLCSYYYEAQTLITMREIVKHANLFSGGGSSKSCEKVIT